jgi:glucose-1-phosphate thymidylyltransferase
MSNLVQIGVYMYDNSIFDVISKLKPSRRHELEIADANMYYVKNEDIEFDILNCWWTDAGTFDSLLEANKRLYKETFKNGKAAAKLKPVSF